MKKSMLQKRFNGQAPRRGFFFIFREIREREREGQGKVVKGREGVAI